MKHLLVLCSALALLNARTARASEANEIVRCLSKDFGSRLQASILANSTYRILVSANNTTQTDIGFYTDLSGTAGLIQFEIPISQCEFGKSNSDPLVFRCSASNIKLAQIHFHGGFEFMANTMLIYLDRNLQQGHLGSIVRKGFHSGIVFTTPKGTFVGSTNLAEDECEAQ